MTDFLCTLLITLIPLTITSLLVLAFYYRSENATILDVFWSIHIFAISLGAFFYHKDYSPHNLVFIFILTLWCGRLSQYLWGRYASGHEDKRYTEHKSENKITTKSGFIPTVIIQALMALLIGTSAVAAFVNSENFNPLLIILSLSLMGLGFIGETIADSQLAAFRIKKPGQVCGHGLWRYTRHPNYFFEWLLWMGVFLFSLKSSLFYFGLFSPVLIFYLLYFKTGMHLAERHMKKSNKPGYVEYLRKTPAFFPWFPKK